MNRMAILPVALSLLVGGLGYSAEGDDKQETVYTEANRTLCWFNPELTLTPNQLKYITALTKGTPAQAVLKKLGTPVLWGNSDRSSEVTQFDFALDYTIKGRAGPLDFIKLKSKQVAWLYMKPGQKASFVEGSCVIIFFTNNKLDKVVTGCLGDIDCG